MKKVIIIYLDMAIIIINLMNMEIIMILNLISKDTFIFLKKDIMKI